MTKLDDYWGVFATTTLAALAVALFGNDTQADGAYSVAGAVCLYILWAGLARPWLRGRTSARETSHDLTSRDK